MVCSAAHLTAARSTMSKLLPFAATLAALSAAVTAQGAVSAPCFEPALGTNLNLTDDSVAVGLPLGFTFPGPGGGAVTAISVSSNGFVWLGTNADSGCCNGDNAKLLAQMPRIAPMWMDLNPSAGGAVWFNTQPAIGSTPASAVVTWAGVPEFPAQGAQTFQLQLFADGSAIVFYDPNTTNFSHVALVGLSQGNGATGNFVDISQTAFSPHDSGTNPTIFEELFFGFDLTTSAWTFVPNGNGGYVLTQKANCPFASVTSFGQGCPKPVTTYELFDSVSLIDLSNTAIEFLPNGSGGYVATPLAGFFNGYTNFQAFFDDDSQGPFNLPFTFSYPGGSTSAIDISSNGFIWLQSGNPNSRCCNGNSFDFVNDPASIAVLWQDLYPPGAAAGSGIFFDVVGTTEAHITWVNVPEYPGQGANTCQITLRSNGSFRLSWGNVANLTHDCLVGFSQGNTSADPGSIDFSAGTFITGSGGTPLRLTPQALSRPALGSTFTMEVDQITAGSLFGIMVFGQTAFPNGVDLTPIGMPDCQLYASLDNLLSFPLTGTPTPFLLPIPATASLAGFILEAQAATLTPGSTPLNLLSSNGLEITLGL